MKSGSHVAHVAVVGHELAFFQPRTFHICSAHRAARAAVDDGRIPADFACPLSSNDCPMRALLDLAPGHDALLSTAARATGDTR